MRTTLACATALTLAACGGGGDPDTADEDLVASEQPTDLETAPGAAANALAAAAPNLGSLALVSATAAGAARGGSIGALEGLTCGMSADGSRVLFNSDSSQLVSGDSNGRTDVFLKDLRSGAVTRVSSQSNGAQMAAGALCVALTPDGSKALLRAPTGGALWVKNVATGVLTLVTPAPTSIPNNTGFAGGAISDDGNRVLFKTEPTTTYAGAYLYVNTVPRRLMLRELSSHTLSTLATDNGRVADGEVDIGPVALSPDGSRAAFISSASTLVAGDSNGQRDVFVRDLGSGATLLASSGTDGLPAAAVVSGNSFYGNVRFAANGRLQFFASQPSSLGPRGEYAKRLDSGQLDLLLNAVEGHSAQLSADGRRLAFLRLVPGSYDSRAFVREQATGLEQVVNATSSGTVGTGTVAGVQISRDGSSVAFGSNASNLRQPAPPAGSFQVYLKTVAAPATTQ